MTPSKDMTVNSALELNDIFSKEWAYEVYKNNPEIRMLVTVGMSRVFRELPTSKFFDINDYDKFKKLIAETLLEVLLYKERERIKDDYIGKPNRPRFE